MSVLRVSTSTLPFILIMTMAMSMRPGTDGDADTACCCYTFRRDSVYCRTILLLEDLKAAGFAECERARSLCSARYLDCLRMICISPIDRR